MKKEILSYAAGIFDGEGTVAVYCYHDKHYKLRVSVSNYNSNVLEFLKKYFGGSVSGGKTNKLYIWLTSGNISLNFLILVYKYLIIKKQQALVGIKFQQHKNDFCKNLKTKHINIKNSIDHKEVKIREKYKIKLHQLKRVY